jgi:hypothetical protein
METRFNSSSSSARKTTVISKLSSVAQELPDSATFPFIKSADQEGFTQFYQKLILPNSTAGKRENPHDDAS